MSEQPVFGFLNIDKPAQMTSHDVVAKVRRGLQVKKVGHAGTLDPMATGVLVLCVGAATRLSEYVMHATKQYRARVHLGITTDTYDADGSVQQERDSSHIIRGDVEQALTAFTGTIEQIPPIYSAIKQGGRKLYDLARAGEPVEVVARRVTIDRITLEDWTPPQFSLDVTCSAGTYIRSLAHDLGEKLGVGAHLDALIRTTSGIFTLEKTVQLDTLLESEDWQQRLISVDVALSHIAPVYLNDEAGDHAIHGRPVIKTEAADGTLARAYSPDGQFIAILQANSGIWRPHKVFLQQN